MLVAAIAHIASALPLSPPLLPELLPLLLPELLPELLPLLLPLLLPELLPLLLVLPSGWVAPPSSKPPLVDELLQPLPYAASGSAAKARTVKMRVGFTAFSS
jgi:hypothetical protein